MTETPPPIPSLQGLGGTAAQPDSPPSTHEGAASGAIDQEQRWDGRNGCMLVARDVGCCHIPPVPISPGIREAHASQPGKSPIIAACGTRYI